MLKQIYVKDFILIDELRLDFQSNMSAFTGETGAGKSLLMDAIGILKGERVRFDMVRQGCNHAFIEGVFTFSDTHPIKTLLVENGYDIEDNIIVVTREIHKAGKSVSRINHRITTVSFLKDVVSSFIDIHSQYDTNQLLSNSSHGQILDDFMGNTILLEKVKNAYNIYKQRREELYRIQQQDYTEDDLDFFTYQFNEIDNAALKEHELEELENCFKQMQSYEKVHEAIQKTLHILQSETNGITSLYTSAKELQPLHGHEQLIQYSEQLMDMYHACLDMTDNIQSYQANMQYDEKELEDLQDRIHLIHKIYRKYGGSFEAVMKKQMELEQHIDSILHRQDALQKYEILCNEAYDQYVELSKQLHTLRKSFAKKLEQKVAKQLKDLQLPNAKFEVAFEEFEGNASGMHNISFLVSMNKGEPLKKLSMVASGGELSRFMLGVKCVMQQFQPSETVIFDEIDTGVSGKVAFAIGKKMQELAQHAQVFCVTHLAPVAACANYQFIVEKRQYKQQTNTNIRLLSEAERIEQLASLSSNSTTESSLQAAKELLQEAHK